MKTTNVAVVLSAFSVGVLGQRGELLFEDNFDSFNSDVWQPDIGDGCGINLCGWGNQELQSYEANNVFIGDVPGEAGNKALILEARRENSGARAFTSGKVTTRGRMSVNFGLLEWRIRVPNLEEGLWPAAWLLGTSNLQWPANGEIDMMEMGHSIEQRTFQGFPWVSRNNFIGSNAFYQGPNGEKVNFAEDDVEYNRPYASSVPMNDRFMTYRLYWEPTSMRWTVEDNGIEYDLVAYPLPIDANGDSAALTKPFYLLLNLAVGGVFTGMMTNDQVTAPLPARVYIDYVRIYKWNGHGTLEFDYSDLEEENGVFGVFTETTPVDSILVPGVDSDIYIWDGTMEDGTTAPFEGSRVLAWRTTAANHWFGGGITSFNGKDMSTYVNSGVMRFKIKIPGGISFRIGITDNYTNQAFVDFPAGQTRYGLVRDGNWGQVEIPLLDLAGLIAFQDIGYLFVITSMDGALPTTTFEMGIDDIYWDNGNGGGGGGSSPTPPPTPTPCTVTGPDGNYVATVSDDAENPSITFTPGRSGVGNNIVILYYSTDANDVFPGYIVSPNVPYTISAGAGQTVYYYYTYSLPEGGEQTSLNSKHSFVVGSC